MAERRPQPRIVQRVALEAGMEAHRARPGSETVLLSAALQLLLTVGEGGIERVDREEAVATLPYQRVQLGIRHVRIFEEYAFQQRHGGAPNSQAIHQADALLHQRLA